MYLYTLALRRRLSYVYIYTFYPHQNLSAPTEQMTTTAETIYAYRI